MSRNPKVDYTKYVHQFTDSWGVTRYAVAEWDATRGQYIAPLSRSVYQLTGCSQECAKTPAGIGGYLTRAQALRHARYIYGKTNGG
jgi:hypothetical protein